MGRIYRQRHPERTVFYRVLFYNYERFVDEYENQFEREYGFLRPIVKDVVNKSLDCGNPRCGFVRRLSKILLTLQYNIEISKHS